MLLEPEQKQSIQQAIKLLLTLQDTLQGAHNNIEVFIVDVLWTEHEELLESYEEAIEQLDECIDTLEKLSKL